MIAPEQLTPLPGTTIHYVDSAGTLRIIAFDATFRDVHQGAAEASFHPLDVNANVTDHVRSSPRALSIECEVTNTPLIPVAGGRETSLAINSTFRNYTSFAGASGGQSFFVPLVGSQGVPVVVSPAVQSSGTSGESVRTWQYATAFDRVKEVWETLDELRASGTAVQVVTRLKTYKEMVIVNVTAPHGIEDAITFGLDFVEILRADSATIQVDPPVKTSEKRAQKDKDAGTQAGYEPAASKQSGARVTLQALADLGVQGGFF